LDAGGFAASDLEASGSMQPDPSEEERWWDEEASADAEAPEQPPGSVPAIFNRLRK
jgi:hypothetical protein